MIVSFDIFIPSINELLEKSLKKDKRSQIIKIFDESQDLKDAHHISTNIENKIRSLVGKDSIVTIHIEPYKVK